MGRPHYYKGIPVEENDEVACPHNRSRDQNQPFSTRKGVLIPVNDDGQGRQSDADKSVGSEGEWVDTGHLLIMSSEGLLVFMAHLFHDGIADTKQARRDQSYQKTQHGDLLHSLGTLHVFTHTHSLPSSILSFGGSQIVVGGDQLTDCTAA